MNNEIGRKTTSLILMTIMVAGGLTFAIPSTVPDAHAQTPNLYVSAVNPTFDNTFGGLQVVQVIVNDPAIDDQSDGQPRVEVDGTKLNMTQAIDGSWYGYFRVSDDWTGTGPAPGINSDMLLRNVNPNDKRDNNNNAKYDNGTQYALNNIQKFESLEDDFDIIYFKAGSTQTVSLTYDDSENNSLELDRTSYPRSSNVYLKITDHVLNIDPTDKDVWTFTVNANQKLVYNAGGDGSYTATAVNLGCDDDCLLKIPNNGVLEDLETLKFEETAANSGIFELMDGDDDPKVMTKADAPRNTNTAITYDDDDKFVQLSLTTATVNLDISDGTWNSGEAIDLTVTDADQNKNSDDEDDQKVSSSTSRIPVFMTGNPFTLNDVKTVKLYNSTTDDNTVNGTTTTYINFDSTRTATIQSHTISGNANPGAMADKSAKDHRLMVESGNFTADATPESIVVWFGMTFDELLRDYTSAGASDFVGEHLLNVDVSSLGKSRLILLGTNSSSTSDGAPTLELNAVGGSQIPLKDFTEIDQGLKLFNVTGLKSAVDTAEIGTKQAALIITPETAMTANTTYPIVFDIFRFGFTDDGAQANERFSDQIIRIEVEETGDNTSVFTGTLEYVMINQLNVNNNATYTDIEPISNDATFVAFEDLTGSDARVNYEATDANGNSVVISDQQDITTSTGVVSLNADRYGVGSNVVITLEDADLNTDSGSRDTYTVVTGNNTDMDRDQIGINVDNMYESILPGSNSLGMLLEVTIDGDRWQYNACTGDNLLDSGVQNGLGATGFTLQETGADTGIFTGSFAIPKERCMIDTPNTKVGVSGKDIGVTYLDFRDASGQIVTAGDSASIGATTGSVSLDRTVYPVPFGSTDTAGASMFKDQDDNLLTASTATVIIQVNDPDYNLNPAGEDKIEVAAGNGPVEITLTRSGNECVIGHAGSDISNANSVLDELRTKFNAAKKAYDAAPTNNTALDEFTRAQANYQSALSTGGACPVSQAFGPLTETSPESGIFEVSLDIAHNHGPSSNDCPDQTTCILQGDIITVQYTDPTDASGNERTVADSATFDLRNGALQTDKSVYVIGSSMIVTLIDPDLDLDSDSRETYPLNIIEWDSDAGTENLDAAVFDAEPGSLRETGPSTGIFQVVIEVPSAFGNDRLERGEEITLTYVDYGPSGADFVGDNTEDIERTVFTSNFGATIELDQAVYTWTDKVFITITAPDHNLDSNQVDEIGADPYPIRVATRSDSIDNYKLVETGTNTGIFTGEVILTGFNYDADGDSTTGTNGNDVSGDTCAACNGPTDGMLPTDNDDGLEVSFEFSDGETVRKSALIRWNIGEVQWLEASYPATSSGILRVIDSDMNLNPEAVDNFEVKVWSSDSPSGITLTVEETQPASGIFEGTVFFGLDVSSGGHRLNVQEGDTVTARYTDNTLPEPYSQGDSETITATTIIGTIVPPLERVGIESLRAVDATGTTLSTVTVDQQIQITSDLTNKQDKDQPFAYLVQIQDAEGVTVSLSWIDGSLTPNQSLSPSVSWTPTAPGTYTVTVFAWESVSTPTALSPQQQTTITVN